VDRVRKGLGNPHQSIMAEAKTLPINYVVTN
jgi:hypothetical protein